MGKRVLIVGGVAGGASAAARIRRLDAGAAITIFERGEHVSFSNCSLPYYLSRTVGDKDDLIMMTPESFKASYDIEVRTGHEVTAIHPEKKTIRVKELATGREYEEGYDQLVLSPGSAPIRPRAIQGVDLPHVFTVRNVNDIVKLDQYVNQSGVQDVVVVGGGFIGLEVAENLAEAGKKVSVVEAAPQVMAPFDYDMVQLLQKELVDNGVELRVGDGVKAITPDKVQLASGGELAAQAVVLAIGVLPETALAKDAGLELGETGAIKVTSDFCTSDPHIPWPGPPCARPGQRRTPSTASPATGGGSSVPARCGSLGSTPPPPASTKRPPSKTASPAIRSTPWPWTRWASCPAAPPSTSSWSLRSPPAGSWGPRPSARATWISASTSSPPLSP